MNNKQLLKAVLSVYKKCKIHDFPFDCFYILNQYNYKTIKYSKIKKESPDLYELCKYMTFDAFTHINGNSIVYNDNKTKERINFTLMHELGHIVLEHSDECNEDDADTFAGMILAPNVMIHYYECQTADDIHDRFGISYAAANRALLRYRHWKNNRQLSEYDNEILGWFTRLAYWLDGDQLVEIEYCNYKPKRKIYNTFELLENPMVLGL